MPTFQTLWDNHPARANVCDATIFRNQCAMRMGDALTKSGVKIPMKGLRTCVGYNRNRFKDHAPGHIRAAQQLANVLKEQPTLLGAHVTCKVMSGSINDNIDTFKNNNGVVFIMNGWDQTDHIDVFNGTSLALKGGAATYRSKGTQVWFWKMT